MKKLVYYLPPPADSSPNNVAYCVWRHLHKARDGLEMDLLLLSDDDGTARGHPDLAIGPDQAEDHVGDAVFFFPVSPIIGLGPAFRRLRKLHRAGARLVSDYHGDLREDLYFHRKNRDVGLFLYTVPSAAMAPTVLNWHEWLILHSRYLERTVRRKYNLRAGTAVVPNGIETEVLDHDHGHVDMEGEISLCYHGRFTYEKGLDLLIQAMASLPDGVREKIHLHLFGRGPMERSLRRKVSRHGFGRQVHFHGHLPMEEVYPALCSADLLVYPSRFDNFPVSVLEALAVAEVPVLFSDRMGLIEFMGPSLKGNAFPLSVEAIHDAVLRVVEGHVDVEATVREQRAFARQHTWDKVIREYLAFFNELP